MKFFPYRVRVYLGKVWSRSEECSFFFVSLSCSLLHTDFQPTPRHLVLFFHTQFHSTWVRCGHALRRFLTLSRRFIFFFTSWTKVWSRSEEFLDAASPFHPFQASGGVSLYTLGRSNSDNDLAGNVCDVRDRDRQKDSETHTHTHIDRQTD